MLMRFYEAQGEFAVGELARHLEINRQRGFTVVLVRFAANGEVAGEA
jgi:acetolactate synthase regulatory subunit